MSLSFFLALPRRFCTVYELLARARDIKDSNALYSLISVLRFHNLRLKDLLKRPPSCIDGNLKGTLRACSLHAHPQHNPFYSHTMADSSAHRPSVTKDGECESQFRHCNECETKANPNYEGCSHPEDPPEFENQLENPVRPPYNVNLHNFDWHHTPGWLLNLYDMIKSNSLTHLFDENHDETCNGIL